jgi:hypothetical protein
MPAIAIGDKNFKRTTFKPEKDLSYDYPDGIDLTPGNPLHNRLRDMLLERAYDSSRTMSNRHKDWVKIDHTLTAYIEVDEEEKLLKEKDARKPVSIVFPNSYTVLETLLSYFVGAFLQEPYFRYEGTDPDSVVGSILLEKIIDIQCAKNKVGLNLHTQARDAFAYGFGVSTPTWVNEYGTKVVKEKVGGFLGFGGTTEHRYIKDHLLFEGNALDNIDPYLYLPDTSVPVFEPQKGEYVGWLNRTNYLKLLSAEKGNPTQIFNVRYLKALLGRTSSIYPSDASGRNTRSGASTNDGLNSRTSQTIDQLKMFIDIIPNDWGLGSNTYPEKWYFELAQDEILIQARPAGLDHNKFPVNVMAPDFDGYSMYPVSRIEMLYGMQGVLDFMFNSHVLNVRKALNDVLIYDPYLVNSHDLQNRGAGGLVRTRRPAWGKGVDKIVQQLGVTDVTRGNVADSGFIVQWMERISGVDQSMQGSLRQGGPERLTGAEFQGTRAGGITRLERLVRVMGMQGMQDIGTFFAVHNRQLMSSPEFVKIAGDWEEVLQAEYGQQVNRGRIKVDPMDLDINYRVQVRDGSVPGGNYSQAWTQLFQILGSSPELAQHFDVVRIFMHIARNLGAKNVNDFVRKGGGIQPKIMPDQEVQQGVQAGNLIPVGM